MKATSGRKQGKTNQSSVDRKVKSAGGKKKRPPSSGVITKVDKN
jgi:hypothetical protein